MIERTKEELTATLRMLPTGEFKAFLGWLDRVTADIKDAMVLEVDEWRLRQLQGEAKALMDIQSAIAKTKAALERMG